MGNRLTTDVWRTLYWQLSYIAPRPTNNFPRWWTSCTVSDICQSSVKLKLFTESVLSKQTTSDMQYVVCTPNPAIEASHSAFQKVLRIGLVAVPRPSRNYGVWSTSVTSHLVTSAHSELLVSAWCVSDVDSDGRVSSLSVLTIQVSLLVDECGSTDYCTW